MESLNNNKFVTYDENVKTINRKTTLSEEFMKAETAGILQANFDIQNQQRRDNNNYSGIDRVIHDLYFEKRRSSKNLLSHVETHSIWVDDEVDVNVAQPVINDMYEKDDDNESTHWIEEFKPVYCSIQ